jgi:CheY-like chemotaxis protein
MFDIVEDMNILLVEDNPGDARLTLEALKESSFNSRIHHVSDGIEALNFLSEKLRLNQRDLPDLILLDLNMPRKNGRELLSDINQNPMLSKIPIVVLTTSDSPDDINECYKLCANCYVTKPVEFEEFIDAVKTIHDFWVKTSRRPPH